jgi:multimeric flavodoxin WrbA
MRVTGIVASPRKTGNSDILVKQALKAAAESGAEVQILRLHDFRIEYCRGCGKCMTREHRECQIKDDVKFIYQQIKQSDGLVFGSPIYIHSVPAILKALIDRMGPHLEREGHGQRKLTSFIFTHTYASQFEHMYALPHLLFFAFYLAFRVSGMLSVSAGPPGACLLDKKNLRQADELGKKLCEDLERSAGQKATFLDEQAGVVCPGCHNLTFNLGSGRIVCPVCKEEGVMAGDSITWQNKSGFGRLKETLDTTFQVIRERLLFFRGNLRTIVETKEEFRDNRTGIPVVGKPKSE